MKGLNTSDYKHILEYYNLPISNNNSINKKKAEEILAIKLCRCIKSVNKQYKNEKIAIPICTKSIYTKK